MPSAGRPFTPALLARLAARGIETAPLVLHTGVSSLEAGERPYPEPYRVPPATAARVEATRRAGGRIVAVGTTVVRALESAAGPDGSVRPAGGWTDLVVTAARGVRVVDGLVTGFHDPDASHLDLLEAVAGPATVARAYHAAARAGYRRHEFGDVALLMRRTPG
jgi:S-adenosylmethionine:tRNA ribosyltransferase-isomerase